MPRLTHQVPSYRLHRASGQAVVNLGGRDIYLGQHGTHESQTRYEQLVAQWLASHRHLSAPGGPEPSDNRNFTVNELFVVYCAGPHCNGADRAASVQRLLVDPATAYVLVTTPSVDGMEEVAWFASHLLERGVTPAAAVINRCQPSFFDGDPEGLPVATGILGIHLDALREVERSARHDAALVAGTGDLFGGAPVAVVPLATAPSRDIDRLGVVAAHLEA